MKARKLAARSTTNLLNVLLLTALQFRQLSDVLPAIEWFANLGGAKIPDF